VERANRNTFSRRENAWEDQSGRYRRRLAKGFESALKLFINDVGIDRFGARSSFLVFSLQDQAFNFESLTASQSPATESHFIS